jgi:hypothetical protein
VLDTSRRQVAVPLEMIKRFLTACLYGSLNNRQLSFQDKKETETTENVNSMLDYYFNPFLTGMAVWQAWCDMYNEFVAIGTRSSLNWFDL